MTSFYGPSIDDVTLQRLHTLLTGRGWQLSDWGVQDSDGLPVDPESWWTYPQAYGGEDFYDLPDVSPSAPSCRFEWDDGDTDTPSAIRLVTAGNPNGCPSHDEAEHRLPLTGDGWDRLAVHLSLVERHSRGLDPRELVACRFFGDCRPE